MNSFKKKKEVREEPKQTSLSPKNVYSSGGKDQDIAHIKSIDKNDYQPEMENMTSNKKFVLFGKNQKKKLSTSLLNSSKVLKS